MTNNDLLLFGYVKQDGAGWLVVVDTLTELAPPCGVNMLTSG